MDLWTFFWIFFTLTVLISILESFHRKSRRRRAAIAQQRMLQEQIRSQPIAVYTIQGNSGNDQQLFSNGNSHAIKIMDDLPPKYEDILATNGGASFILMPHQQQPVPPSISMPSPIEQTTPAVEPSPVATNVR